MIDLALQEFRKLEIEGLYQMDRIVSWLTLFKPLSIEIRNSLATMYQYEIDGELLRLPPVNLESSLEERFLDLYKSLNELNEIYSREEYFGKILLEFDKVKDDTEKVKIWLSKNECLWKEYIGFYFDYVEGSEEVDHLNIFFLNYKKTEVNLDRKNFRYLIQFLNLFGNN